MSDGDAIFAAAMAIAITVVFIYVVFWVQELENRIAKLEKERKP